MSSSPLTRVSLVFVTVLALAVCYQAQHEWYSKDATGNRTFAVRDFGAFYCAGAARDAGADPYLAADFIDCGGRRAGHAPIRDRFDSPAPIPGYDVALFALIARLPYVAAAYAWLLVCALAVFGGAVLLARTAALPPALVAVLFSIIAMVAFSWGQVAPIALGGLCLFAYAIAFDAMWLAGMAAIACAIEPHVGIPAILAAACYLPKTRAPLAIAIALLAVVSLAALGVHGNLEYLTKVTPLHVAAEVAMNNQYSLTWLLHAFGIPAGIAIELGSFSYVLMTALGLALARPVARAVGSPAAIVLVPVACAMLGGPFIHNNQLALALPAILLVAGRVRGTEAMLWSAAALLAAVWWVPQWQVHAYGPTRFESLAVIAIVAYYATARVAPKRAIPTAAAAAIAYLAITAALLHFPAISWERPDSAQAYAARIGDDIAYASGRYGVTIRENAAILTRYSWQLVAIKVPYWLAPILFIIAIVRRTRTEHPNFAYGYDA